MTALISLPVRLAAAAVCLIMFGCSRGHAPSDPLPQPLAASVAVSASSMTTATAPSAVPTATSPRLEDERWKRAMGEDLADKQALAEALGATGLLEALDDGGEITKTALASIPFADDADLALGPVAKRMLASSGDGRLVYLTVLLEIAGRPANAREPVDPEGAAEAGSAVLTIATDTSSPREHRAVAISAARALAEKKVIDPAKIPSDLDSQ